MYIVDIIPTIKPIFVDVIFDVPITFFEMIPTLVPIIKP
jgi:hypothetical protein